MTGFIKNLKCVEESDNSEDLLGYATPAQQFAQYIESLTIAPCLIILIGSHGVGKSFALNMAKSILCKSKTGSFWHNFNTWRYAERSNFWLACIAELENSILDSKSKSGPFKDIRKRLRYYEKTYGSLYFLHIFLIFIIFTSSLWAITLGSNFFNTMTFLVAFFAFTVTILRLYSDHVLHRQEGYESMLIGNIEKLIKYKYKNLYIVLENVDISDKQMMICLETISYSLRKLPEHMSEKLSIKIIIPTPHPLHQYPPRQKASLLKAIDYQYIFRIRHLDLESFVDKVFKENYLQNDKRLHIQYLLNLLFRIEDQNIRICKTVLREANARYIYLTKTYGSNVNHIICIAIEVSKHLETAGQSTVFEEAVQYEHIKDIDINSFLIRHVIYGDWNNEKFDKAVASGHIVLNQEVHIRKFIPEEKYTGLSIKTDSKTKSYEIAQYYFD